MSPDPVLAILYDLSQVISSEKRLQPLLKRVLQRLLFHTTLPSGMLLLGKPGEPVAECVAVVGDPELAARQGHWLPVPDGVLHTEAGWLAGETVRALCPSGRWGQAMRLPIPDAGIFLLFLPSSAAPHHRPEMIASLMPALCALAPVVEACRAEESASQTLRRDRDQARQDLALALRESQDRLHLLQHISDTLPDMIWLKSMDGRYLFGNKALCDFIGCSRAHLQGRNDEDLFDTHMARCNVHQDQSVVGGNGLQVFEQAVRNPVNGQEQLVQVSKQVVFDDAGAPLGIMGIARDVTEQRRHDRALRQAASVFTHAREGIMIITAQNTVLDINQAYCQMTGFSRDELIGRAPRLLVDQEQDAAFYRRISAELAQQGYWSGELWNQRCNGERYPQQLTITQVHDAEGRLQQYVVLAHDVSQQKAYEQQLRHAAHYDALTGLPNRLLLGEVMAGHARAAARDGTKLAVAYLDLDGFKDINDTHGHAVGDAFLVEISRRMAASLPEGDVIARVGGDEFIVLLGDVDSLAAALKRIDALLPVASGTMMLDGRMLQATVSVGLALDSGEGRVDAELLIRQADHAMYQAKLQGKNCCCVFEAESERALRGRQERLEEIRQALVRNQFVLFFQPKVNLRTGQLVGVEALVRWQHPQQGLLPPAAFLPLIEQHELSVSLGRWVLERSLEQIAAWQARGLTLQVSVNIGARHLQQATFLEELVNALARHPQVPASLLQLEIVETSALDDIEHASALLQACRDLGVSSAIDDFGTGYSSLSYLKRLPVKQLKVDRSFVSDMLDDPDDLAILEGIVGLARPFGCEVIAEGVESEEHGILLLQLGCELGQGYGIGRPMPADALLDWQDRWRPPASWAQPSIARTDGVLLMRACIYLRAWMNKVAAYAQGRSERPPEMLPDQCLFTRWLLRLEAESTVPASLLDVIRQTHGQLHVMGQALVRSVQAQDSEGFPRLHQQLCQTGQMLIDRMMDHARLAMNQAPAGEPFHEPALV